MAKGKKNKNKKQDVDVVQEIQKDKATGQKTQQQKQPDTVKQTTQQKHQQKTEATLHDPSQSKPVQQSTQQNKQPQTIHSQAVPSVNQMQKIPQNQNITTTVSEETRKNVQQSLAATKQQNPEPKVELHQQTKPVQQTKNQPLIVNTLVRPQSIDINIGKEVLRTQEAKFVTPLISPEQPRYSQQCADLPYRQQLMDGLSLVAKIDQQILKNPLQHQQEAHGPPRFSNFDPIVQHYKEKELQQIRQAEINQNKGSDKKLDQRQILQQIKQSAESLEPDPLDQVVDTDSKVNILKSFHSQQSQQRNKSEQKEKSNEKKSETKSRRSSVQPNKQPDVPAFPLQNPSNKVLNTQVKNKVDYQQINKQILKQRQQEWQKMREKQLQPRRPSFVYVHPSVDVTTKAQSVLPNAPQHLSYTNNLSIINKQKQARKGSGQLEQNTMRVNKSPFHQEKQNIKKEKSEIKQQIQEIQKLQKDVNRDNSMKKIGISAIITAACLGACVLAKLDKRIAGGATVASFIVSYLAQK